MHLRILLCFLSFISTVVLSSAFFLKEKVFCYKVCPLYCPPKKEKKIEHDDIWTSWHPHPTHYHYHQHIYNWHEDDGSYIYDDAEFSPDFEYHHPKYWHPPKTTTSTTTKAPPTTTAEPSGICMICMKKCSPWDKNPWDKNPWDKHPWE